MIEEPGLLGRIRLRCREVAERARFVRIDDQGLATFAARLAALPWPEEDLDPAHHFIGEDRDTLAFMMTLDAINFGSGWFPKLRKRPGLSGYQTIAGAYKDHAEREGSWTPERLRRTTADQMARLLEQDLSDPDVAELMSLFAQAWRELGEWLKQGYEDRFEVVLERADHSADRLTRQLSQMPLYRDVAQYGDLEVPLYKRAQITAADLHRAFGQREWGRFDDLASLTLFADNLVPHVLRCEGVLRYDASLARQIDAEEQMTAGSEEETEIRAVAVEAVERLVSSLGEMGRETTAFALDGLLWNAGQAPAIKARPRHRARSTFY